ncbi:DNA methyltransferase [Candidatus Poriferisodalis sp.]|uniref:DNA methyltransferase n=1 Tax=Candidatus Poriferisodalis sp. TaxID=3101277 RepID=UPI003B0216E3
MQTVPWTDEQISKWYTLEDERGRFTRLRLRNPSSRGLSEWRGLRHGTGSWNAPKSGHDAEWIEREFIAGYRSVEDASDRLDALDAAGLLHWPDQEGGLPTLKKYLAHADTTVPVGDVWADLPGGRGLPPKERTGWPTQKPLALLERIISASSNEGDIVLDPFAGCATACAATERLGRHWAGIDIDEVAVGITQKRLQQHADGTAFLDLSTQTVYLPATPQRTDDDAPRRSPNIRAILWQTLGTGERRPCPGCDRAKWHDDFHLDHIEPKSKGGPDIDANLQLLCAACNGRKGNRLTMSELRATWGLPPGITTEVPYSELGAASGHEAET